MSRDIPDGPLSDEDRTYLVERSKFRTIRLLDSKYGVEATPAKGLEPAGSGPTGEGTGQPPVEANSQEEIDWVNSLDLEELKEELAKEKQPVSGKKAELQKRLLDVLAAQD